jgi:hypothetical protein
MKKTKTPKTQKNAPPKALPKMSAALKQELTATRNKRRAEGMYCHRCKQSRGDVGLVRLRWTVEVEPDPEGRILDGHQSYHGEICLPCFRAVRTTVNAALEAAHA